MSNQLQHRLSHFEVDPPAAMWDAISEALDDQATTTADKLRHFEAAPAPRLWQHIEAGLDSEEGVPVRTIPFYKRYARPLRYTSAVAALVLVAFTLTLLLHKTGESRQVARQQPVSQPVRPVVQPTAPTATVREREEPQQQPRAHKKTKESIARATNPAASLPEDHSTAVKATHRIPANRYLTVASETGTPVRLSKKVYPVFDCAEHSTALERYQCQENIESLQKMASSLISPSGDFASLMDMIKTLEENR